jgi:hypothetical protein
MPKISDLIQLETIGVLFGVSQEYELKEGYGTEMALRWLMKHNVILCESDAKMKRELPVYMWDYAVTTKGKEYLNALLAVPLVTNGIQPGKIKSEV